MCNWHLVVTLTVCLSLGVNAEFPNDPKPCKYGDEECLTKIIEYFLHEKSLGDSSINLVKTDPLIVKELTLAQGAESPVSIVVTFANSEMFGFKSAKVVKVKGFGKDLQQKHELTLRLDRLDLVGDYTISGKVLVLPITGSGKSNISLANVDINLKFNGVALEKDGAVYMKIDKFRMQHKPKRIYYKFDNLFNGDKALGDNMNLFLNDNWADIFPEVKGIVDSGFGKVFEKVIAEVFMKYPYNKFFVE